MSAQQIGTLQRRQIQTDVIKPIYEVIVRELGQDKARRRKELRFSLQTKARTRAKGQAQRPQR